MEVNVTLLDPQTGIEIVAGETTGTVGIIPAATVTLKVDCTPLFKIVMVYDPLG